MELFFAGCLTRDAMYVKILQSATTIPRPIQAHQDGAGVYNKRGFVQVTCFEYGQASKSPVLHKEGKYAESRSLSRICAVTGSARQYGQSRCAEKSK